MVTRDYILLVKTKTVAAKYPESKSSAFVLNEAVTMPDVGLTIPVRVAKAKLSALLELVAGGQEITITSGGKPKAVLSPVGSHQARKVFTGMGDYLMLQPVHGGPGAEVIVREDRDGRGW